MFISKEISVKTSIQEVVEASPVTGDSVDLLGFNAAMIVVDIGALGNADNTGTLDVEESDDDSQYTSVAAGDLDGGALPAINNTKDLATYVRAYLGTKRYIRVNSSAIAGTTPSAYIHALVIRSRAESIPVTQG